MYPLLDTLREHGEATRVHPNIPTQLMIFDRSLAVVRIDPLDPSCGAMFIRVRNLIELLIDLFDRIWDEAKPLFLTGLESAPTSRGARILALVGNGVTDDAIARTLQVSRRTVGREIAELKAGLGVASRAEIVGAAVRRGWL
jgi:DNA-binding CsgD family transcriptional regulator